VYLTLLGALWLPQSMYSPARIVCVLHMCA
jgi:hypothetical protein